MLVGEISVDEAIHELHKGVMEYLSLHGLPGDKELRQKVMERLIS